jgi:hypothetical protein
MEIVVRTDRLDDAGAGGIGRFQGYFLFFNDSEHIGQVLAVKSDFCFLPFYGGIDFSDIFTQFFGFGGNNNFTRRQFAARGYDQADTTGTDACVITMESLKYVK